MGYSARYHAMSLVAVFLALAIGILIGAEFGGDTAQQHRARTSRTASSATSQDARDRADQLGGELGRANEFAEPRLPGRWSATSSRAGGSGCSRIGDLPGDISDAVEEALGPTGGAPGRGRRRPRAGRRARRWPATSRRRASPTSPTNPDTQSAFGVGIGRQVVRGGTLVDRVRGHLFSRASGNFGGLDGVIVVRDQPDGHGAEASAPSPASSSPG